MSAPEIGERQYHVPLLGCRFCCHHANTILYNLLLINYSPLMLDSKSSMNPV